MTYTVKWWPRHRPIPKGWRIAAQSVSHHSAHAILIEKVGS